MTSIINIPSIFHQIWLGEKPMPFILKTFTKTWIKQHPEYEFMLWNDEKCIELVEKKFSYLLPQYQSLPYIVQKVDLMKYLILYEIGGIYVDLDYECLKPIDNLLTKKCCIGLEPKSYAEFHKRDYFLGNAFMGSQPNSDFFKNTIDYFVRNFDYTIKNNLKMSKYEFVLSTTGPKMLNNVYDNYTETENIYLIPDSNVAPFTQRQAAIYRENKHNGYYPEVLKDAYAIHHFLSLWL